jgi:hypothetical protein
MTLNEIAYDILSLQGKYKIGNSRFSDLLETVKRSIVNHYSLYVRRDIDRNGVSDEYLTNITIELIKVDKSDAICRPVGCLVMRSKNKIPKVVRTKDNTYKFIGNLTRDIIFTKTRQEELRFTYNNDFTSDIPRYILKNEYLYVFNWKGKYVSIEDIFLSFGEGNLCENGVCFDFDGANVDFPIPSDILNTVQTEILKELVNA